MKKDKILIILLSILLIISIGIIVILRIDLKNIKDEQDVKTDVKEFNKMIDFKNEFEKLNGEETGDGNSYSNVNINTNVSIVYINSLEKFNELLNSDSAIIYVGSPTCAYCRNTISTLLEVMEKLELKTLYYYNGKSSTNSSEQYDEIMNEFVNKGIAKIRDNGKKSFGMPLVINVRNKEIKEIVRGVTYKLDDGQTNYDNLTDSQKELVYNRYYSALSNID